MDASNYFAKLELALEQAFAKFEETAASPPFSTVAQQVHDVQQKIDVARDRLTDTRNKLANVKADVAALDDELAARRQQIAEVEATRRRSPQVQLADDAPLLTNDQIHTMIHKMIGTSHASIVATVPPSERSTDPGDVTALDEGDWTAQERRRARKTFRQREE